MGQIRWLLAVLLVVLGGSRLASADSPAFPKLPPLWRGALYAVIGCYEQALAASDELFRTDPNNRDAYLLRGHAHLFKRDNPRQAIADFSEVLRHNPYNAAVYLARALAYEQTKEYDRTIADCTEAIHLDPRSSEAYAIRGACYEWKRVIGKAIADYTAALRIDPETRGTRVLRARAYMDHRGEGARALADYDELVRQHPNDREIKNDICLIYLVFFRDYDRVIADAGELIRQDPLEPRWYWLRSMAHFAKGEYVLGCCEAGVAIHLNPRRLQIRISPHSLVVCLVQPNQPNLVFTRDRKHENPIDACTKRLQRDPKNLAAYYERAYAYFAKRDYKHAIADFDEIIRLDPSDAEALRKRGCLRAKLGSYTDALDDYAKAMRLEPGNPEDYAGRCHVYVSTHKYEEALHDCSAAIRLDSRFELPFIQRGWLYEKCGKYDLAIADYYEAICLSPASPTPYLRRAEARCSVGDFAGAITDFKQVIKLEPANSYALAQLATVLSSSWDARLRDGKEARKLATAACKASSWRDWHSLASLACAYAECGDFEAAVKWATKARELAPDSHKSYMEKGLKLYRAHKPCRATPPQGASMLPSSR